MNQQTSPTVAGVPPAFLNRFGDSITGVLSGFDRLRLRGTLRHLFQPTVMEAYLNACRVLIKDFGTFAQGLTTRIKAAAYATAEQSGRPFRYLPYSQISKASADVCRAVVRDGRRHRALNPWSEKDAALLAAVSRGEYTINGRRNRDVRRQLWAKVGTDKEERRRAAAVTRQLRLLRAHGLLRKVSGTHRYVVTEGGRKIITALLAARQADVEQLTALAA